MQSSSPSLNFDLVILGGGVAGLWLLNRLCNAGYNAVLFEHQALGTGQTVASQGMIHGGVKYTLSGALSGASEAIADMPAYWKKCLEGGGQQEGLVDLSQTKTLSDCFYMWSTASSLSKVTTFFASKALRGRVNKLARQDYPEVFQHSQFKGELYQLVDKVIDTPSLIKNLALNMAGRVFSIDWQKSHLEAHGNTVSLKMAGGMEINAQQFIFSAGKGNQDLLEQVQAEKPQMQLRPLQQVMVKHNNDYPLYAHCIGRDSTPRLTISSHRCDDGSLCWYLGGQLSETGVGKTPEALIAEAKQELQTLFPWLDWQGSRWQTLNIERAEPRQKNFARPDQAFIKQACHVSGAVMNNVAVAWPTKLTLVPNLGDEALQLLQSLGITPKYGDSVEELALCSDVPKAALSPWDALEEAQWQV